MAYQKTDAAKEHNGPKRGMGYWGVKADAKREGSKVRRQVAKKVIKEQMEDK